MPIRAMMRQFGAASMTAAVIGAQLFMIASTWGAAASRAASFAGDNPICSFACGGTISSASTRPSTSRSIAKSGHA